MLSSLSKASAAGIFIGFAGAVYLLSPTPLIGSIFFSIGLISVILLNANLFTGKIGYIKSYREIPDLLIMLAGNCLGAWLMGLVASPIVSTIAASSMLAKLSNPCVLFTSFFCGISVYLAVDLYKKNKNIFLIILPVTIFVSCGFNHCIADFFYMAASCIYSIPHLLLCIIGNSIGAVVVNKLTNT